MTVWRCHTAPPRAASRSAPRRARASRPRWQGNPRPARTDEPSASRGSVSQPPTQMCSCASSQAHERWLFAGERLHRRADAAEPASGRRPGHLLSCRENLAELNERPAKRGWRDAAPAPRSRVAEYVLLARSGVLRVSRRDPCLPSPEVGIRSCRSAPEAAVRMAVPRGRRSRSERSRPRLARLRQASRGAARSRGEHGLVSLVAAHFDRRGVLGCRCRGRGAGAGVGGR